MHSPTTHTSGYRSPNSATIHSWLAICAVDRHPLVAIQENGPGVLLRGHLQRLIVAAYLNFGGSPKSSGGNSICGISILILLGSTVDGLSSSAVTVTGNAITSATIMTCNPTQGRAPQ